MSGRTILLVDDEQHLLDTVQFILAAHRYRVVTAHNGEEAIAQLHRLRAGGEQADLILTDLQMPGASGPELIERLRTAAERTPILVMTGYTDRETARKLSASGCACCLDKPFEEEELLARIRELLERA